MRDRRWMMMVVLVGWVQAGLGLDVYEQAVADPSRSAEAVARDVHRQPLTVVRFAGVRPGQRVLEIAPGAGYYTAILSRVLGEDGEVVAVDPERLFAVFEQGREGFRRFAAQDPRANVTYSTQVLDRLVVPEGLDQAWMVLYYHDTLWTGEDRARMNARIYDALKPGGRYLVLDHHAVAGAGPGVGRALHRMDRAVAVREIQAAGFSLVNESDALARADDPRDDSVFDATRRGRTDRFLLLFQKPM